MNESKAEMARALPQDTKAHREGNLSDAPNLGGDVLPLYEFGE
jgi:hypothetical protein